MAITINEQPGNLAFSKNVIKYKVTTSLGLTVKARVRVETAPYSDVWAFVTELKAVPDGAGVCLFYLHSLLEGDLLEYDKPDLYEENKQCTQVCRRFKLEFWEYDPSLFTLHANIFFEKNLFKTIPTLESSKFYIIIQDSDFYVETIFFDGNYHYALGRELYSLADESWGFLKPPFDCNQILAMEGTLLKLYEAYAPVLIESNKTSILLAGRDLKQEHINIDEPDFQIVPISTTELLLNWHFDFSIQTSFDIERSVNGSGWSPLTSSAEQTYNYIDSNLILGNSYGYRIRAMNLYRHTWLTTFFKVIPYVFGDGTEIFNDEGFFYDGILVP